MLVLLRDTPSWLWNSLTATSSMWNSFTVALSWRSNKRPAKTWMYFQTSPCASRCPFLVEEPSFQRPSQEVVITQATCMCFWILGRVSGVVVTINKQRNKRVSSCRRWVQSLLASCQGLQTTSEPFRSGFPTESRNRDHFLVSFAEFYWFQTISIATESEKGLYQLHFNLWPFVKFVTKVWPDLFG